MGDQLMIDKTRRGGREYCWQSMSPSRNAHYCIAASQHSDFIHRSQQISRGLVRLVGIILSTETDTTERDAHGKVCSHVSPRVLNFSTDHFPSRRRVDVFVPLVPFPVHYLACVRLHTRTIQERRESNTQLPHIRDVLVCVCVYCVLRTSSFSTLTSAYMRMSSGTSKRNRGPVLPRALFLIRS